MISLEKKYGVRSTFFVRVCVVRLQRDCCVLHELLFGTIWFSFDSRCGGWKK